VVCCFKRRKGSKGEIDQVKYSLVDPETWQHEAVLMNDPGLGEYDCISTLAVNLKPHDPCHVLVCTNRLSNSKKFLGMK
jgi:hypothetical protein